MCSCGPPHMANQKQDDQLEHSYSSYVMIQDVTPKTCRRRWMLGRRGERGSGISVLAARYDDDDDESKSKVKLVTTVEGDPKAPFSISTTPRYRRGHYSIPRIAPLILDPYLIMLSVKQGGIKYNILSLWYDSTWNWTPVSWTIGELDDITWY